MTKRDRPVIYSPHGQGIQGYCPNNLGWPGYGTAGATGPFGGHATLSDGLIAYWKMDETSGTRVDEVNSYDLTDQNTCGFAADGMDGNAANMVRARSEALTQADSAFDPQNTAFSLAFWLRHTNLATVQDTASLALSGANQAWLWRSNTNGSVNFYCWNSAGGFKSDCNLAAGTLTAATWHFVVLYHDPDNDERFTSVDDGNSDTGVVEDGGMRSGGTATFNLGGRTGAYGDCDVDAAGYWTKVLSSAEISALAAGLYY